MKIDSSITGVGSVSRQLTAATVRQLLSQDSGAEVVERDLALESIDHLTLPAFADESVLDEFLASDTIVIGAPMYNFGVPSQLKRGSTASRLPARPSATPPMGLRAWPGTSA